MNIQIKDNERNNSYINNVYKVEIVINKTTYELLETIDGNLRY